jgi:hypothetical protein
MRQHNDFKDLSQFKAIRSQGNVNVGNAYWVINSVQGGRLDRNEGK